MKRASIAAAVLVALALTGCAGTVAATPDEPEDTATTSVEETVAPLVAETPSTQPGDDADAAFVAEVRENLRPANIIPNATDDQIIAAGENACAQLAAGKPSDQISVIEGEHAEDSGYYTDSLIIIAGALSHLCPRD